MRIQLLSLIIIFSLLVSFPAIASDWVRLLSTKDFTAYIDKQSIKGDTSSRKFWLRYIHKNKQKVPESGKYYVEDIQYWEIDCSNDIVKVHEIHYYSSDETLVDNYSFSTPVVIRVPPDTVGVAVEKYVCDFKPTK